MSIEKRLCVCGCGKELAKNARPSARYILGHQLNVKHKKAAVEQEKHLPKLFTASDEELKKIVEESKILEDGDQDGKDFDGQDVVAEEPKQEEIKSSSTQPEKPLDVKKIHDDMKTRQPKESLIFNPYILVTGCVILAAVLQLWLFSTIVKIPVIGFLIIGIIDFIIWVALIIIIWKQRKLKKVITFESVEQFLREVPKWALTEKAPNSGIIGKFLKAGKQYKQLVLVSENYEPKKIWVEWDGFMFVVDNRGYRPPRDVRGDCFFYHVDKQQPLIDSAEITDEDAEDSFHLAAVRNEAFELGRIAAMGEVWGQIKLIMILCIANLALLLLIGIFLYSQIGAINDQVADVVTKVTAYIAEQKGGVVP